ncbi:MAG: membrane protein insertase YidC [Planctomycetota bacterium]|nr:MAG: membrane protein insertase YidC [Planctomycetota bacterium]
MDQPQQPLFDRRTLISMLLLGVFLLVWMPTIQRLFPAFFGGKPAPAAIAEDDKTTDDKDKQPEGPLPNFEEGPAATHILGTDAPGKGYFLQVQLNSRGASVDWAKLNDPRYLTLDRKEQLKVVGNLPPNADGTEPLSFNTAIDQINSQIKPLKKTTEKAHWKLLPGATSETATFLVQAPDNSVAVRKTYTLQKGDEANRDEDAAGYVLKIDLSIENLKAAPTKQSYRLQGPVGLPLENVANSRTLMEVKVATHGDLSDPSDISHLIRTAGEITTQFDKAKIDSYLDPIHYAGIDVQFFSALVLPSKDQLLDANKDGNADRYFSSVYPTIVARNTDKPIRSSISLRMQTHEFEIAAGKTLTHSYRVFLGPKQKAIAQALELELSLREPEFSLFKPFTFCARPVEKLLQLLLGFYGTFAPYGLAIIMLTFSVRMCLLPLTRKQVRDGEKMKIITPQITKLKEKYANEPEKFMLAQRELMKRYNHNMLGGCLPLFIQMPIFIGLYGAVNTCLDLRLAKFLWIDNLAAPDALFSFGREIWGVGSTFNLLPLFNVGLFLFQQRQMMPPPTNDEERMRNNMMNGMTVVMGFLFYSVPSGLCLYFIASSILGMIERWALKKFMPPIVVAPAPMTVSPTGAVTPELIDPNRPKSFIEKLLEAADAARKQTDGQKPKR